MDLHHQADFEDGFGQPAREVTGTRPGRIEPDRTGAIPINISPAIAERLTSTKTVQVKYLYLQLEKLGFNEKLQWVDCSFVRLAMKEKRFPLRDKWMSSMARSGRINV